MQHALTHGCDGLGNIIGFEQLIALRVNHLALVVGDIVVFEQLLADVEVAAFDLTLSRFERARNQWMLDRLAFRHLQAFHNRLQTLASENPQQGIVEREIEARGARITLTT